MSAFITPVAVHFRRSAALTTSSFTAPVGLPHSVPCRRVVAPRMQTSTSSTSTAASPTSSGNAPQLVVMVNGMPGRMAAATADAVVARGLTLADEALTGPGMDAIYSVPGRDEPVSLVAPDDHEASLKRMVAAHPGLIVVDYTHPSAANRNVDMYVAAGASFVIGTTGGDADAMHTSVNSRTNADVLAVIAPNMGKQIVAFQAIMDMMAKQFPNAFAGYNLSVKESHQKTKADTSGTAKAVVASMNKLGLDFSIDQIDKLRDKERSMTELHVPEEYIDAGHAFHTYSITSPDGTVSFEFQHNVCGRKFYAEGTVDAVNFLHAQRYNGSAPDKRVFSMIDVLRSGAMS